MDIKNKRVLVTGADGFIGSHLVEALVNGGAKVRALSYYNSFNNWGWLETVDCLEQIDVVCGDVRDPHFVKETVAGMDVIFNLAALIAIPYSYTAPDSYIDTNIKGALNLCQAAKESGCQRVLHTSTSEVYGTARYVPIDENHPLQPQSPYSASKIGADSIALSFYHAFDLPLVVARPFNTYGPRQSARAVIPTLITQLAMGQKEIQLGCLSPTRDFNYVKDTVKGMMALAQHDAAIGEVVNIGSDSEISIKDLAALIQRIMNTNAHIREDAQRLRPKKSEVNQLRCDNSKLKKLTNYVPSFTLEQGLEETVTWIKKNLEKYKINLYNV